MPGAETTASTNVDQATGERFLRQWTRNAIVQIKRPPAGETMFAFLNATPRDPQRPVGPQVLYCGAGPELFSDLGLPDYIDDAATARESPVIQQLRRRFFLIAADTALAPLLWLGLVPDLVLSIDSGPGTYFHLAAAARIQPAFSFPVLTNLAGARCLPLFFQRRLFYRSTTPLDQWLAAGPLAEIVEWANPTRNAIGLAIHVAGLLRSTGIRTAGANFRSRGSQTHVRGTGYTEYFLSRAHRTAPLATYRPGGYITRAGGPERTEKNALTHAKTSAMAATAGIDLRPLRLNDGHATDADPIDGPGLEHTRAAFALPAANVRAIPAAALSAFLDETRARVDADIFARWNIRTADLDRWLRTGN